jgi:hypothetical protein
MRHLPLYLAVAALLALFSLAARDISGALQHLPVFLHKKEFTDDPGDGECMKHDAMGNRGKGAPCFAWVNSTFDCFHGDEGDDQGDNQGGNEGEHINERGRKPSSLSPGQQKQCICNSTNGDFWDKFTK